MIESLGMPHTEIDLILVNVGAGPTVRSEGAASWQLHH